MTSYWPVWWRRCEVVLLYPNGGVWVAIHAFHHHHDSFLVCLSRLKFGTLRLGIWLVESRCSVYILRQPDYFRMGWNKPVGVVLRMAPLVTEDRIAWIHSHILIGVGPNFGANYDVRLVKVPTKAISPSYPTRYLDTSNTEKPMHQLPIPALNCRICKLERWDRKLQNLLICLKMFEEHHNSNSWYSWYSYIYVFSILMHD